MNKFKIYDVKHKWRRTETLYPETLIRDDDWSLLDATDGRIAHLFNTVGGTTSSAHGAGECGMIIKYMKIANVPEQKLGRPARGYWLNISKRR